MTRKCLFAAAAVSFAFSTIFLRATTLFVSPGSSNPTPPYSNWDTAAHTIQDAIDAASDNDLVFVTNGLYNTGGHTARETVTNRVAISKPLTVQSVNGPAVTIIEGYQLSSSTNGPGAVRCVYMTNNTALIGFTLTHGATDTNLSLNYDTSGGGVYCENFTNCVLSNCVITANSAGTAGGGVVLGTLNNCVISSNSAIGGGGGVDFSTLNHCVIEGNQAPRGAGAWGDVGLAYDGYWSSLNYCVLIGNSATTDGGGAEDYLLNSCLVVGNSAQTGGGAADCRVFNCTIVSNSAPYGAGVAYCYTANSIVYYNNGPNIDQDLQTGPISITEFTCTPTLPPYWPGNFTNAPLFVNPSAGDFRLQPNSPCINSGNNTFLTITNNFLVNPADAYLTVISNDLDGNPRIAGGNVDAGAYEFQSPTSVISYAWLMQNGFPTDGSADFADPDHDGMNNWQEWRAGTIPTDPSSLLKLSPPVLSLSGATVSWQCQTNIVYYVQSTSSLSNPFSTIQSNIVGVTGPINYTDTNAPGNATSFYRVGVQ